jgi:putative transposase
VDEEDYWFLWERLVEGAAKHACAVHAYTLMPDHIHLVATPANEDGLGKLLQHLGRYYVQYFNRRYRRTGTLWEGRYRATLIDPDTYVLPCSRYVELNPVRKGLVSEPGDYGWSSFVCNTTGQEDALVTPHPAYQALGEDATERREAYRASFDTPLSPTTLQRIRESTNKAWVLGDEGFVAKVTSELNRRPTPLPRGGDRRSEAYRQGRDKP